MIFAGIAVKVNTAIFPVGEGLALFWMDTLAAVRSRGGILHNG